MRSLCFALLTGLVLACAGGASKNDDGIPDAGNGGSTGGLDLAVGANTAAGAGSSGGIVAAGGSAGGLGGAGPAAGGSAVTNAGSAGSGECNSYPEPSEEAGVFDGDVFLLETADAAALQGYSEISGTLWVQPSFAGTLELPNLRRIGGINVESTIAAGQLTESQITRIIVPNLTHVESDLWIYLNFELVEADFRKLESVGGRVWIYRDTMLKVLRLDALRTVGEDFHMGGDFLIPDCLTDALSEQVTAGSLGLDGDPNSGCHCETLCGHVQSLCP